MCRLSALLLAGLFLAACAGTTSPTAVLSGSLAGAELVGPVILDAQNTSATVTVGRMVVFDVDDPTTWQITADPEGVVEVQEGRDDGSAIFNPGAEALKPGEATVTLTNPAGDELVFTITVE